jgi:hypothetical protein
LYRSRTGFGVELNLLFLYIALAAGFPLSMAGLAVIAGLGWLLPPIDHIYVGLAYWLILGAFAWLQWVVLIPKLIRRLEKARLNTDPGPPHRRG